MNPETHTRGPFSPGRVLEAVQGREDGRPGQVIAALHAEHVLTYGRGAEGSSGRAPHAHLQGVLAVVLVLVQDHLSLVGSDTYLLYALLVGVLSIGSLFTIKGLGDDLYSRRV